MQNFYKPSGAVVCGFLLLLCGCRMGGGTRANFAPCPQPAPPSTPNTPQLGPSAPFPQGQPGEPSLEGPSLDGPLLPPSSQGFDRQRRTQSPVDDWRSNYAETAPAPVIPDGPIAHQQTSARKRLDEPSVGYVELPPAP